jgi:hypothetical protein
MVLKGGVSIRPVPARIGGHGSSGCNKAVEVVGRDTDTDTHRRERIPHAANVGGNGRNADERCLGPADTARPNQPASGQTRQAGRIRISEPFQLQIRAALRQRSRLGTAPQPEPREI